MVLRLQNDWRSGRNRFDQPGEAMFGALQHGELIGTCGRNIDPYDPLPRAGRVRRLYVGQAGRRQGIGRQLIEAICHGARSHFDHLNTQAPTEAFPFYERLGFVRITDDVHVSHRLTLGQPSLTASLLFHLGTSQSIVG